MAKVSWPNFCNSFIDIHYFSLIFLQIKTRLKSIKRDLQPGDILEKFKHLINGKVVILTPNLVVTRTSPTPEEISPTNDTNSKSKALAKSLEVNLNHYL